MENPKSENEAVYAPTVKPGDPEKQKHPEKGRLVRFTGGQPVYEADMPGFVRPSEEKAKADAAKVVEPGKKEKKGK